MTTYKSSKLITLGKLISLPYSFYLRIVLLFRLQLVSLQTTESIRNLYSLLSRCQKGFLYFVRVQWHYYLITNLHLNPLCRSNNSRSDTNTIIIPFHHLHQIYIFCRWCSSIAALLHNIFLNNIFYSPRLFYKSSPSILNSTSIPPSTLTAAEKPSKGRPSYTGINSLD